MALSDSVKLRGKWDWSETSNSNRWTTSQEAIRVKRNRFPDLPGDNTDLDYSVGYSKLKIRGKGRSLVLEYRSSDSKGFKILGWSIPMTVETVD